MSPFTFIANRIDRFVLPLVSRHALDVLKREYDHTSMHQILWHAWHAFGGRMKIQPAPCCSSAYGPQPRRARIVLLLAAAVLLVAGVIGSRRNPAAYAPVVHESIVVEAESPRAVAAKLTGTYSVQVGDMRNQVSVLVASRDGHAVPLDRLDARASYRPRGGSNTAIALEPMNDHLMANVDPSQAGTLTVALATDGLRQQLTFELPFSTQ